jgi:4-hydroxy-tetrahydrodipicolinate synthase
MLKRGCYPASVTPFDAKGKIDMAALANLLAWFKSNGCAGAVLAGTNGEGPSLSATEKRDLVRGAVPIGHELGLQIILGVATPSLDEATWLCRQAGQSGAEAVLLMPPGYFREASEEGLEAWFNAVMDASPLDILIYNFPKRAGISISCELMGRLAQHPKMAGLKDSSGEVQNLPGYRSVLPAEKVLYVGDETLLLQALDHGWTGTISGAANLIPRWLSQIATEEDLASREVKFQMVLPALKAIRTTPQPAGNKMILKRLGVLERDDVKLPLLGASDSAVADAADLVATLS